MNHPSHEKTHCASCTPSTEKDHFFLFVLSAIFSFPLFVNMFASFLGAESFIPPWAQAILATVVQVYCAKPFYIATFQSLRQYTFNMDSLIVIGTTAAYLWSLIVLFLQLPESLYFETSGIIITLVLMGRWLESFSRGKASQALQQLLQLTPQHASVLREGQWKEVAVEEIVKEDLFRVRAGEKVPVDGEITEGESSFDESMLSGESVPVFKKRGEAIFAATTNLEGAVQAVAKQVGSQTRLAGIIHLVKQAQESRAPIQRLADVVSSYFVPAVLGISLLTFLLSPVFGIFWQESLLRAVAVLVIACPCALGLATPTVIVVASGLAAQNGILFRDAEAIEQAEKIQHLAFDKTGTITEGKPVVVQEISLVNSTPSFLSIAVALEEHSLHPYAKAIVEYGKNKKVTIPKVGEFRSIAGKGVEGVIEGKTYFVGSLNALKERQIYCDQHQTLHLDFARQNPIEALRAERGSLSPTGKGNEEDRLDKVAANRNAKFDADRNIKEEFPKQATHTHVGVAEEKQLLGCFALRDSIRPTSRQALEQLHKMDIQTLMLTGDRFSIAEQIAKEVGIDAFEAELSPEQKAKRIEKEKQKGVIGMVGDGINDAPALAAASVGFAISSGSDIAMEASDVTLMRNDLLDAVSAIRLSQATMRKARQNLFFAFIYNSLGIPLAALGLLHPIIAAAAMALSSVSVITNALLLNRWKSTS